MKLRTTVVALVLFVGADTLVRTQSLGDIAKKAAADKVAKAKAGAPPPKTITLQGSPAAPAKPVTLDADAKTQDALAALRAVKSVLDGGANAAEFKRYYLEAKVKVDALADTRGAALLRAIANLYADAVTMSIAVQVSELSGSDVVALKTQYAADYEVLEFLGRIPDRGIGAAMTKTEREIGLMNARATKQMFLNRAAEKLSAIKSE
jgi:hypothetical protein